jgi:hypothetical protein
MSLIWCMANKYFVEALGVIMIIFVRADRSCCANPCTGCAVMFVELFLSVLFAAFLRAGVITFLLLCGVYRLIFVTARCWFTC